MIKIKLSINDPMNYLILNTFNHVGGHESYNYNASWF